MVSMLAIRDVLALQGRMDSSAISHQLKASPALVQAMLERMEAMGKVARVVASSDNCYSGSCRGCPESKRCATEQWTLMS
ncbi:putative [Fe-S]-dependent transcriptional repressor [Salmonella enterica subsp. enterica serovar Choleraesuis]|nr:putative [Fe-S]-dependent transcriptional repressor [Salmonella enterica subsp. enterica serovar Choleraesuis]